MFPLLCSNTASSLIFFWVLVARRLTGTQSQLLFKCYLHYKEMQPISSVKMRNIRLAADCPIKTLPSCLNHLTRHPKAFEHIFFRLILGCKTTRCRWQSTFTVKWTTAVELQVSCHHFLIHWPATEAIGERVGGRVSKISMRFSATQTLCLQSLTAKTLKLLICLQKNVDFFSFCADAGSAVGLLVTRTCKMKVLSIHLQMLKTETFFLSLWLCFLFLQNYIFSLCSRWKKLSYRFYFRQKYKSTHITLNIDPSILVILTHLKKNGVALTSNNKRDI